MMETTIEIPPQRMLLATGNRHKLQEFRELCAGRAVQILGPDDWQGEGHPPLPDVAETGETFLDNALLKAEAAFRATGLTCVADDSGLTVEALAGAPGVHSARFSGPEATDASNRALLLEKLADISDRRAAFQCVLVVCGPLAEGPGCGRTDDGAPWRAFAGSVQGRILTGARGENGFGYDALFLADGLDRTFAEASAEEKHALSHRGHAFAQLRTWLAAVQFEQKTRKPLFVRAVGLHTLARALERAIDKGLRYADSALENALGEQTQLGSKERAAVAHLHWHVLRRLSFLQLAARAVTNAGPPRQPPDPRRLIRQDAQLLACLALADVDPMGEIRDHKKKAGPPSALQALAARAPNLRLPVQPDQLDAALRAATYVAESLDDDGRAALELGCTIAFLRAGRAELGDRHIRAALGYLDRRGPLTVRANRLSTTRDDLAAVLAAAEIATVPIDGLPDALLCLEPSRLTALPAFQEGQFEIQDQGSQHIVQWVAAQPGEIVLDWCAGAGGKTLGIAASMQNRGTLLALDTHVARLTECERRLQRAGATCARTQPLPARGRIGLPLADAVLVDSPCSSTGALRRNPELRWHLDTDWLDRFPDQQLAILMRAAAYVRPGGRLIYATCSILRRENEDVVQSFLNAGAEFTIAAEHRLGPADPAYLELRPLAQIGPDGFYCCILRRKS